MVKVLRAATWDVLRGIDAYPKRTSDRVHFARAAQEGRVLVSNDKLRESMVSVATARLRLVSPPR